MDTITSYDKYIPTHVLFGVGQLNNLHKQQLLGKRALIVISNGKSTRANGYLARTEEQLHKVGIETALYAGVSPNPNVPNAEDGAKCAREFGADFLVALGGGSVMDCSKAIALLATNEGGLWDYIPIGTGKGMPVKNNPLPIVAITTTAGTGSETDSGAVITNEETNEKSFIMHPLLFPVLAIVDPELMLTVPPQFTAFQGFDALFHSVEGFVTSNANLASDLHAREAIRNIAEYLPRAVKDGSDIEARTRVAFANTLSGNVMGLTSLTSEHGMEHALSAYHPNLPHGAGLIIISKAYFSYLVRHHACDDRFIEMARLMGMPEADKAEDFITALVRLQEACGVADLKMSDYGISADECEKFMRNACDIMTVMFLGDRVKMSEADVKQIYVDSYR